MRKYDEGPIQTTKCCSCVSFDVNASCYYSVLLKVGLFLFVFVFLETWPVVLKVHLRVQKPFILTNTAF